MKFYNPDTVFNFGKFSGKTLSEIIHLDPSYIDWCAINLEHFYITEDVINQIKSIKSDFFISESGYQILKEKIKSWEIEQEVDDDYDDRDYDRDDRDYDRDNFNALTDGQYGSYDDWCDNGGDFDSLRDSLGY